jgi:Spy/CpxP family protein refolding chaperone
MKRLELSTLAMVACLGLAAAAHAQTPPAPPPPPGAMAGQHGGGWNPERMREHREMRREAHLKALHDALNIKPEQEAAFATFAESMKRPPAPMGEAPEGMHDGAAMAAMTTPERVDAMTKRMDEHMARAHERMQRHADAVKALYAALSPEQRHTLDALPDLMGRPHGGTGMDLHGPMGEDHGRQGE